MNKVHHFLFQPRSLFIHMRPKRTKYENFNSHHQSFATFDEKYYCLLSMPISNLNEGHDDTVRERDREQNRWEKISL